MQRVAQVRQRQLIRVKLENMARKHHVMAAPPNMGVEENGATFSADFLVPRHKIWLLPLLECRAVTLAI